MELSVVLPHQRAIPASSSAPDHRRGRQPRQLPRRLHRPMRDENQLHAAVVELVAHDDASSSTRRCRTGAPATHQGRSGIFNFVTKRGWRPGKRLAHRLDADRDRLGHHLEVPERVCCGRRLQRRVPLHRRLQPPPTGRHRHQDDPPGPRHHQPHRLQGISAGVRSNATAAWCASTGPPARNHTQCDSLLIGPDCGATPSPTSTAARATPWSSTKPPPPASPKSACSTCQQRGIDPQDATALIVGGFCQAVLEELPMEFALEAKALLAVSLEGAVG